MDREEPKMIYRKIITFFVLPPSKEILYERLTNRDMKDKLIVSERMKEFYSDIKHWVDYDYVVINRDINICVKQIKNIIDSERLKRSRLINLTNFVNKFRS